MICSDNKRLPDSEGESVKQLYIANDHMLDRACNQLYFGPGVFKDEGHDEERELLTHEVMGEFIAEYTPILNRIGESGAISTLHHLIELYPYLADTEPSLVFNRISDILLGSAVRGLPIQGPCGRYSCSACQPLAAHCTVFTEPGQRMRLAEVLTYSWMLTGQRH